jgi:predicted metalloprotease with PDZ domain
MKKAPGKSQKAMRRVILAAAAVLSVPLTARQGGTTAPVVYRVSFPAPEHRFAQVEATFGQVPQPLELRMSRSSPGRYALHEFAKNVYDVHAFDGAGKALEITRPNPYQWNVTSTDGIVRALYKVYGDHVDGTYLGIDETHAHMNLPATLMWARHLEDRPARVTFVPPDGRDWKPATQLFPGDSPWTFTAPNLQYLFDSPTELSAYALREFTVRNPDGKTYTIRAAVHSSASADEVDRYAAGLEKIVNEAVTVYGEFPQYEPGTYTFLADYLPYDSGDGMEHRNSTVVTGRALGSALSTASHEFFHCWNVERIRPQGLEPFTFEEANMTDSLWLAEGFTQYYGVLVMTRAGLARIRGGSGAGRCADGVEWEGDHDTAGISGDPARGEARRSDVDRVHPA